MPRRTKTKPARIATRNVAGGKTIAKKTKMTPSGPKELNRKDMRFSVSLVILIGMLSFSLLLLLISLNKSVAVRAGASVSRVVPKAVSNSASKTTVVKPTVFSGLRGDFQLTIPASWKDWVYRPGETKSPIDDALSDAYIKIYLPNTINENEDANSPNLDSRYQNLITVLTYSTDEWKAMEKKCARGNNSVCDDMGTKLADTQCSGFAENTDCVYSYTKQPNCGGTLEDRCNEVDKIMESFQLK